MESQLLNILKLMGGLVVAIYLMQLIKSFAYMSFNELRRRARGGNQQAKRILRARLHGLRLWFLIWSLMAFVLVLAITAIDGLISNFVLVVIIDIALIIGLLFAMPWAKWPAPNLTLAASASPVLGYILDKLSGVFNIFKPLKFSQRIQTETPVYIHSKTNLMEVIKSLKIETDSPEIVASIDLAVSTLRFNTQKIKTLLKPMTDMKIVFIDQILSLKLINELHRSGLTIFPVKHSQTQEICGILYLSDVKKLQPQNATVSEAMRPEIYYVNLEAPLQDVIEAFLSTHHHLFLATDSSKKIRGCITIIDVINQYFKQQNLPKFTKYDELYLVAQRSQLTPPKQSKNNN